MQLMVHPELRKRYERKLSPVERFHLVADELYPPYVAQLVIEGEGDFDLSRWQLAARQASAANPGSRLVLRRYLGWSHWVESKKSFRVHMLDGAKWSGWSPEGAPFLRRPLPCRSGPTAEILLLSGNPSRVIFRAQHSVMDGIGGLRVVDDVFRELQGEPSIGARGTHTDLEVARKLGAGRIKLEKDRCQSPFLTTGVDESTAGSSWQRITIPGNYSKLLGKITWVVAQRAHVARQQTPSTAIKAPANSAPMRFHIPVDMRHHCSGHPPSTGNVTGIITIDVSESDTVADITRAIDVQRQGNREGMVVETLGLIRWFPIRLLAHYWKHRIQRTYKKGRFFTSASISNIGLLPIQHYQGGGFKAKTAFAIPPGNTGIPLLILFNSTGEQVEIVGMGPDSVAFREQLEKLLTELKNALEEDAFLDPH